MVAAAGRRGRRGRRSTPSPGPTVDAAAIAEATREVPVQVNGKLRDKVIVPSDLTRRGARGAALAAPRIAALLAGRTPGSRHPGRRRQLVNIVLRDG